MVDIPAQDLCCADGDAAIAEGRTDDVRCLAVVIMGTTIQLEGSRRLMAVASAVAARKTGPN